MMATEDYVFDNCIKWNEGECRRALREANDANVRVPNNAKRRDFNGNETKLTPEEYRAVRAKDAERFAQNVMSLRQRRPV